MVEVGHTGGKYCVVTLDWDYKKCLLDASMPTYIPQTLHKYQHPTPKQPQHSPYPAPIKKYGKAAQMEEPDNPSPAIALDKQKRIQ
eukprot:7948296-Ditylum_brightwellii.AAC.1